MELIELQCSAPLKDKFASIDLKSFYHYLTNYAKMTAFASKILCIWDNISMRAGILSDEH